MKKIALAIVVSSTMASASALADASKTITQLAVETPALSTLVAALTAANLAETLNGPGPFTVFAPTNAAFSALPAGTVDSLLAEPSKKALTGVLLYHVISGTSYADPLRLLGEEIIKTAGGSVAKFKRPIASDAYYFVNNAKLASAKDSHGNSKLVKIAARNGTVYVIDRVLLPETAEQFAR